MADLFGMGEGTFLPGFGPPEEADPSLGTDVRMPDGSTRHFAEGQNPTIFMGDSREQDGGWAAAVPGTEEYAHYRSQKQRSTTQGALAVLALVGGAALGGAMSGGSTAAPATTAAPAAPAAVGAGALTGVPALPAGVGYIGGGGAAASAASAAGPAMAAMPALPAALTAAAPAAIAPTFFQRVGSFLTSNRDIIGSVIAGVGQQIATADAQTDLLRERHELTSSNYRGTDPARTYRRTAENTQTMTPAERFAPANVGGWGLSYDPKTGKMIRELMPQRTP